MPTLNPSQWDNETLKDCRSAVLFGEQGPGDKYRPGVAAQHPLTAYTGMQVLEAGGSAADALVAMVVVDQVVVPGTSSLGGTLALIYHEVASGRTHVLNAGMNSPLEGAQYSSEDQATGRAVLVPGVIRGLETAWQRFGHLAWADLWQPAHYFAEAGFTVYDYYSSLLRYRLPIILRHPTGRAIFAPEGALPPTGILFKQPALAATFEHIARYGADYFYRGDLAGQLVAAVREQGGYLTLADLARYEATWEEPAVGTYLDYELRTVSTPQYGGPALLVMLNLAEALQLHEQSDRETVARTFYDEIQIYKSAAGLGEVAPTLMLNPAFTTPEQQTAFKWVLSKDYARQKAASWRTSPSSAPVEPPAPGTHQLVIVDKAGNIASATHSISSAPWGDSGIFVGGIALNSSAQLLQAAQLRVKRAGYDPAVFFPPGSRHCEGLCSYLVFREGRPYLAAGATGAGLLGCNFQNTLNVLGHGLSLAESVERSRWGFFELSLSQPSNQSQPALQRLQTEPFKEDLLAEVEQLGQPLSRRNRAGQSVKYPELALAQRYADTGGWTALGFGSLGGGVTDPRQAGLFQPPGVQKSVPPV